MKKLFGALFGLGLLVAGGTAQAAFISANPINNGNGTLNIAMCAGLTECLIEKNYTSVGEMQINFSVAQAGGTTVYSLDETITNNTGIAWTDFHWELEFEVGVEFGNPDIGTFTVITPMTDMIWAEGGIVNPGESFLATILVEVTTAGTATSFFNVKQIPTTSTVPEPGTLAILGLGLVGLGIARRKRKA